MKLRVGSYVGDGTDNRQITGIGFQPDLVWVKRGGSGTGYPAWRSSNLAGDLSVFFANEAAAADCIQSLDADGFTLGTSTSVNASGATYYYAAFCDNGADFAVGGYTGNGTDNRDITGLGFEPDYVVVRCRSQARYSYARTDQFVGDLSANHFGGEYANLIQSFGADGFQVGNQADINYSGWEYTWFAFLAVAGWSASGLYAGNGVDGRQIAGLGFAPDVVVVIGEVTSSVFRTSSMPGDATYGFGLGSGQTNRIQALLSDGFEVGTDTTVNQVGKNYRWFAFRQGDTQGPALKTSSDSGVATETVVGREMAAAETATGQDAVASRAIQGAEAAAGTDSGAIARYDSDSASATETEIAIVPNVISRVEVQATVVPGLTDRLELMADVFHDRITDAVELLATISPLVVDRVMLEAAVLNQAQEAAGQAQVIAPAAQVEFL